MENSLASKLDETFSGVIATILTIHQTRSMMERATNQAGLADLCGSQSTFLVTGISDLDSHFHELLQTVESSREQFFCSNWHSKIVPIACDCKFQVCWACRQCMMSVK